MFKFRLSWPLNPALTFIIAGCMCGRLSHEGYDDAKIKEGHVNSDDKGPPNFSLKEEFQNEHNLRNISSYPTGIVLTEGLTPVLINGTGDWDSDNGEDDGLEWNTKNNSTYYTPST